MVKKYVKKYAKKASKDTRQDRQIKKITTKLKQMAPEMGYIGTAQATPQSVVSATPYNILLNPSTQGDTIDQRQKQKIHMKYIDLQLFIGNAPGTLTDPWGVRVLLVLCKNPKGTNNSTNALTGTLTGVAGPTRTTMRFYDVVSRDFKNEFKILYDKSYMLPAIGTTEDERQRRIIRIRKRLNYMINYNTQVTGTISDIETNALYLLVYTDTTSATGCYACHSSVITFTDV